MLAPAVSIPIQAVALHLLLVTVVVLGNYDRGMMLTLERANHQGIELRRLRDRDRARHARFLQQNGVVDFPVGGTFNPFLVGLYYTRVKLGTPAKEYYVQIDTGSDALWVNCNTCSTCPKSSTLKIPIEFFDPSTSSTASSISCSDNLCNLGAQSSEMLCSVQNQCGYKFQYGDGSGASGYYLSDKIYLDTVVGSTMSNSSASIVFGCSTSLTGDLTRSNSAVDGIFGFGQQSVSVISQLYSKGITPNAFSHCLSGQDGGGGILVLGRVVDPNIVYTPLVPSQTHYNINLKSISVNGQTVSINPSVFSTSENTGTIIDSGTTLAYLADGAYDPVIDAIVQTASQYAQPVTVKGNHCFFTSSSESNGFPNVSLNFDHGASMVLKPEDYLLQQNVNGGQVIWCIAIQKVEGQDLSIIGDIVLKDKVVVYDLAAQRIGWTDYDCSSSVTISTSNTNTTESVNGGNLNNKSTNDSKIRYDSFTLILSTTIAFLSHIAFFGIYRLN